ncbi:hypothetical protein MGH68_01670 [Erysipelothrix sp. D19-032]
MKPEEPFVVSDGYQSRILVSCDYFTTTEVILDDFKNYYLDDTSFEGIVVVDGYLTITQNDTVVELKKGESAFIDANTPNIKISGIARYLSIEYKKKKTRIHAVSSFAFPTQLYAVWVFAPAITLTTHSVD